MQVDLSYSLQMPDEEGVLVEQIPRTAALYMTLLELGVVLLDEGDLFSRESSMC
jgi:hypothetical protein